MRRDQVFRHYSFSKMGTRTGSQKAARAVRPESEEITHDVLWGLRPEMFYTGKVVRRKPVREVN